jgi:RNA polymerase sigma factor (sigma-70 family)
MPVSRYENPEWKDVSFLQTANVERLLKKAAKVAGEPEWSAPLGSIYETLRRRRPNGVVEGENPEAWISKTVDGAIRKYYQFEHPQGNRKPVELEPSVVNDTEVKELSDLVQRALGRLSAQERKLIVRRYGYQCARETLVDISKWLGVSEPTARKWIRATEEKLRNELTKVDSIREDYCDEHGRTCLPRSRPRFT